MVRRIPWQKAPVKMASTRAAPDKRKIEHVDLTGGTSRGVPAIVYEPPRKVPRSNVPATRDFVGFSQLNEPSFQDLPASQLPPSTQQEIDDEAAADEVFDGDQSVEDIFSTYELYGKVTARLVIVLLV